MKNYKLNILVAYPYLKPSAVKVLYEFDKQYPDTLRFMLDSGAFTAFTLGKVITLDEYCKFIKTLPIEPWRYFMLDVIGDEEKTNENYKLMLDRGLNPLPIYTHGADLGVIDSFYDKTDFIGVGGLVGLAKNKKLRSLNDIGNRVGARKAHYLGYTSLEGLKKFRPYSCDSSSWSGAMRFGSAKLYTGNGQWLSVHKKDFLKRPKQAVIDVLRSYGINPKLLASKAEWVNGGRGDRAVELIAHRSWAKLSFDIEKNIGTKLFLACASDWQITGFIDAWKFWSGKK